jgi:hypothetical protein
MLSSIERVYRFSCWSGHRWRKEENCERNDAELPNSAKYHRD